VATPDRLLVWSIDETDGFDACWASIDGTRLSAEGRAVAQRPASWWLSYRLETGDDFVHRLLVVESRWEGGAATLELRRDDGGEPRRSVWTANGEPRPDLAAALDCDLMACPLTNTMPVLRHGLHRAAGDRTFLMAFVQVPDLRVVANEQRYAHLEERADGALVRYRSDGFQSDLTIDGDGFVVDYPRLGRRLPARAPAIGRESS
jgi:uncharacterized protein